jgi:O-acetyl-ADP-ribose deacetylase (regulator of RNase III)
MTKIKQFMTPKPPHPARHFDVANTAVAPPPGMEAEGAMIIIPAGTTRGLLDIQPHSAVYVGTTFGDLSQPSDDVSKPTRNHDATCVTYRVNPDSTVELVMTMSDGCGGHDPTAPHLDPCIARIAQNSCRLLAKEMATPKTPDELAKDSREMVQATGKALVNNKDATTNLAGVRFFQTGPDTAAIVGASLSNQRWLLIDTETGKITQINNTKLADGTERDDCRNKACVGGLDTGGEFAGSYKLDELEVFRETFTGNLKALMIFGATDGAYHQLPKLRENGEVNELRIDCEALANLVRVKECKTSGELASRLQTLIEARAKDQRSIQRNAFPIFQEYSQLMSIFKSLCMEAFHPTAQEVDLATQMKPNIAFEQMKLTDFKKTYLNQNIDFNHLPEEQLAEHKKLQKNLEGAKKAFDEAALSIQLMSLLVDLDRAEFTHSTLDTISECCMDMSKVSNLIEAYIKKGNVAGAELKKLRKLNSDLIKTVINPLNELKSKWEKSEKYTVWTNRSLDDATFVVASPCGPVNPPASISNQLQAKANALEGSIASAYSSALTTLPSLYLKEKWITYESSLRAGIREWTTPVESEQLTNLKPQQHIVLPSPLASLEKDRRDVISRYLAEARGPNQDQIRELERTFNEQIEDHLKSRKDKLKKLEADCNTPKLLNGDQEQRKQQISTLRQKFINELSQEVKNLNDWFRKEIRSVHVNSQLEPQLANINARRAELSKEHELRELQALYDRYGDDEDETPNCLLIGEQINKLEELIKTEKQLASLGSAAAAQEEETKEPGPRGKDRRPVPPLSVRIPAARLNVPPPPVHTPTLTSSTSSSSVSSASSSSNSTQLTAFNAGEAQAASPAVRHAYGINPEAPWYKAMQNLATEHLNAKREKLARNDLWMLPNDKWETREKNSGIYFSHEAQGEKDVGTYLLPRVCKSFAIVQEECEVVQPEGAKAATIIKWQNREAIVDYAKACVNAHLKNLDLECIDGRGFDFNDTMITFVQQRGKQAVAYDFLVGEKTVNEVKRDLATAMGCRPNEIVLSLGRIKIPDCNIPLALLSTDSGANLKTLEVRTSVPVPQAAAAKKGPKGLAPAIEEVVGFPGDLPKADKAKIHSKLSQDGLALHLDFSQHRGIDVSIRKQNMFDSGAEVIVNAANTHLGGGGGIDGDIHDNGGAGYAKEHAGLKQRYNSQYTEGYAAMIGSGDLARQASPINNVIVVAGPSGEATAKTETQLYSCYYNALVLAHEQRKKSLAFPSISTGIFGFSRDRAAEVSLRAIQDFLDVYNIPDGSTPLKTISIHFLPPKQGSKWDDFKAYHDALKL